MDAMKQISSKNYVSLCASAVPKIGVIVFSERSRNVLFSVSWSSPAEFASAVASSETGVSDEDEGL